MGSRSEQTTLYEKAAGAATAVKDAVVQTGDKISETVTKATHRSQENADEARHKAEHGSSLGEANSAGDAVKQVGDRISETATKAKNKASEATGFFLSFFSFFLVFSLCLFVLFLFFLFVFFGAFFLFCLLCVFVWNDFFAKLQSNLLDAASNRASHGNEYR